MGGKKLKSFTSNDLWDNPQEWQQDSGHLCGSGVWRAGEILYGGGEGAGLWEGRVHRGNQISIHPWTRTTKRSIGEGRKQKKFWKDEKGDNTKAIEGVGLEKYALKTTNGKRLLGIKGGKSPKVKGTVLQKGPRKTKGAKE